MRLSLPFGFSPETQDTGRRDGRQGWSAAPSKGSGWALPNASISVLKNQKPTWRPGAAERGTARADLQSQGERGPRGAERPEG